MMLSNGVRSTPHLRVEPTRVSRRVYMLITFGEGARVCISTINFPEPRSFVSEERSRCESVPCASFLVRTFSTPAKTGQDNESFFCALSVT